MRIYRHLNAALRNYKGFDYEFGKEETQNNQLTWDLFSNVLLLSTPQNPPLTAKPCKITPSLLEVMSEDEVAVSEKRSKTSTQLLSAEQRLPHPEAADQPPGGEEYPGYVTLRKATFIPGPTANMYVHNRSTHESERQPLTERSGHTCADGPDCDLRCSGNEFLNQSYVPQAEPAGGFKCSNESGNLYTNLACR